MNKLFKNKDTTYSSKFSQWSIWYGFKFCFRNAKIILAAETGLGAYYYMNKLFKNKDTTYSCILFVISLSMLVVPYSK